VELSIAESIAWGLLSFIALIAWCRWRGTPEDQGEVKPPSTPKKRTPASYEQNEKREQQNTARFRHRSAAAPKAKREPANLRQAANLQPAQHDFR
jgi:hypothetical protein